MPRLKRLKMFRAVTQNYEPVPTVPNNLYHAMERAKEIGGKVQEAFRRKDGEMIWADYHLEYDFMVSADVFGYDSKKEEFWAMNLITLNKRPISPDGYNHYRMVYCSKKTYEEMEYVYTDELAALAAIDFWTITSDWEVKHRYTREDKEHPLAIVYRRKCRE